MNKLKKWVQNWLQLLTIPADSGGTHSVGLQQFPHPVRMWKACWLSVSITYLFSAAWEKPLSISHVCFLKKKKIFQSRTCTLFFHASKGKWKDGNRQTVHYSEFLDTFWPTRFMASFVSWKNKITKSCQCQLFCLIWPCVLVLFFITLFATIGVYIVHLVMAVINCSFPLLLHEPSPSGFRHKRLIAITPSSARKCRPLFSPFSQSKYVMKLAITTNRLAEFFQSNPL